MKFGSALFLSLALLGAHGIGVAQTANPSTPPVASTYVAPPWAYKTQQLNKTQVDQLLAEPQKLLIIDLRRPDELVKYGSFRTYLNVQIKDLVEVLDYIPKDRKLLLVSNRAHRAGQAGDLLSTKGYAVAGAIGSEDYREAGGTVYKIEPPAPNKNASPAK